MGVPESGRLRTGLLNQPLVRFLAVGGAIYLALAWFAPDRDAVKNPPIGLETRHIVVEREALLAFVQTRTQQPDAHASARAFDALAPEQRQGWIDRFVREEALVREAQALGLDRDDELIRRRLVQKMEFLTLGVVEEESATSEAELEAFYRAHSEEYRVPTLLTFAHVFVRAAGEAAVPAAAQTLLAELNDSQVDVARALRLGDRFLYNRHYVERTLDEVRSHFGASMAAALERANLDPDTWQGPMASEHGWHLVLMTGRRESRLPGFGEIEKSLRQDLEREKSERALESALSTIVSRYRVDLGPGLSAE